MVNLPLEIIHNIIAISLPQSELYNRGREEFLLPLCQVHSSLRRFVQRLIFSQISLKSSDALTRFLVTVEGQSETFDFGGCVRWLEWTELGGDATAADDWLRRIIDCCREIEEVRLIDDRINLAILSKLSSGFVHSLLRHPSSPQELEFCSLRCHGADHIVFQPAIGESGSLASLRDLVITDSTVSTSTSETCFTPANLPSLRLFSVDSTTFDAPLTCPSTLFAADLRHLYFAKDQLPLLLATRRLRSLTYHAHDHRLSFPNDHCFETPLLAIRLHTNFTSEWEQGLLEFAVRSGLINTGTIVFFAEMFESDGELNGTKQWCHSNGMRVEWFDGELETRWRDAADVWTGGNREFTRWVDRRVEARIATGSET